MAASTRARIDSRNDRYQVLEALKTNRRKRSEEGRIFVEGIEAIKQALASGRAEPASLLVREGSPLSDWAKDLVEGGTFPEILSLRDELYEGLSDKAEPAEIMATFALPKLSLGEVSIPEKPFILIFDRPSDLGNLGSVIRSANSFGVDLVLTHGHCVDLWDPKVIRSSLGAVFRTPCLHVESFAELETWLGVLKREKGLVVAGSDSSGDFPLGRETREGEGPRLQRPIALVLGNEAKGMSVKLKELADFIVSIPLAGQVNSLNVACAATVLMWEVSKSG